jgi:hypothetical protein
VKQKLLNVMAEIVELLDECGWETKADWFREEIKLFGQLSPDSPDFGPELLKLRGIIAGMGSFSDLPLYPPRESSLSSQDARDRQWELAERLGETIEELLSEQN